MALTFWIEVYHVKGSGCLPGLLPAIGHHSQTNVDKCLQFDPLEVWEKEGLCEDDLGRTVLVLDHTLQPMSYHLLQVLVLRNKE